MDVSDNEIGGDGAAAFAKALRVNTSLQHLNLGQNDLAEAGGAALGSGLAHCPSLSSLVLDSNSLGPTGGDAVATALQSLHSPCLTQLSMALNGLAEAGEALAKAVEASTALTSLDLRSNSLASCDGSKLGPTVAAHPCLRSVDLSDNGITVLPIACQLQLAKREPALRLDLSNNPLSSPPLGRRADAETLHEYLSALHFEPAAITRIRLMVCGFGGVGKTTFCTAATRSPEELARFHGSLTHVLTWDVRMIGAWARCLGTEWSEAAAAALEAGAVEGKGLNALLVRDDGVNRPAKALEDLTAAMSARHRKQLALAIGSLLRKGYFSTVGAVKVEGSITLRGGAHSDSTVRDCSLVDFAGRMRLWPRMRSSRPCLLSLACTHAHALSLSRALHTLSSSLLCVPCALLVHPLSEMEYLVSHQLLLASMHTLVMVIQPAPSFGSPGNRHHGSWSYWLSWVRILHS